MMNDYTNAKKIFKNVRSKQSFSIKPHCFQVLTRDPKNGFALVHLGFCLKVGDRNLEEGLKYLKMGIDSGMKQLDRFPKPKTTGQAGTQDARFYFHLGDAMQRLGLVKQVRVNSFSQGMHS